MVKRPENPKLVAVREFPRRLLQSKAHLTSQKGIEVSWSWIAKKAGKSTTVMSQIKTGERPPTVEEGVVFADLFGVRVAWLLLGDGPMVEAIPSTRPRTRPAHAGDFGEQGPGDQRTG